ncbi:PREDICTED: A-agglutinin anchorage subunit-like isoform X4 [Acropora digitifera]|uniref:A-agglutinin anchorage subunit-like isoform X4 n=1 Tax=Acropora digitifera TaxID=70779 RepID=UPI00077AE280|nr:PREDICTED: A-agglutinin anchorage subunit-like isoform X4 [Acropora digitifera]
MGGSFWLCGAIIFLCFLTCGGSSTGISATPSASSSVSSTTSSSASHTSSSRSTTSTVTSSLSDVSSSTPALQVVAYSTRADITLMANVTPTTSISASTTATTPKSGAGTEFWEKAIDLVSPLGTFIIAVVSLGLLLILLIALIVVCCKYKRLKEKTGFPDHMAISDSEWMRSNNDLMMWERNLRASEVHIDDS